MLSKLEFNSLFTTVLLQLTLIFATLACVDALAYFLLPDSIAAIFPDYRVENRKMTAMGGRSGYPKHYFVAHPTRGVDIGPNRQGTHNFLDHEYVIWSNNLGCFDRDWKEFPDRYIYFAGDSFTWGYADFEDKFATIFEARTGIPSLKCGVTHTGQAHQFDKFKEISAKVGRYPARVIVGYYINDIANDFAHPHASAVDGWQVDTVYLDAAGKKVVVERSWIEQEIAAALTRSDPEAQTLYFRIRAVAWRYSLVVQLQRALRNSLRSNSGTGDQLLPGQYRYGSQVIEAIYTLDKSVVKGGMIDYEKNPIAGANREALLAWKAHAIEHKYTLSLLLIPDKSNWSNRLLYSDVRRFLDANGIEHLDLTETTSSISPEAAFWPRDAHNSPAGNLFIANALIERWGQAKR